MNYKKILITIITLVSSVLFLQGIAGQNSTDYPITFSISDGSSGTAAPYLYIKNTSAYTSLCQTSGSDTDRTYSFEDATDYDFNDIVVQAYVSNNNSDSPSIFVSELKKDASYDHEVWMKINIPAGHKALFEGNYYNSGTQNIKVIASTAESVGKTVEIKIVSSDNFSLSVSPASLTVAQNDNGSMKVTVNYLNDFSGDVDLSVQNLPSGVSAVFNPSTVTGSSGDIKYSDLKISVSKTAPLGKHSFTIKGESASQTKEITAELEIIEAPDFAINAAPQSVKTEPGKTAVYTIKIIPEGGFADRVLLSAVNLPNGFNASFDSSSIVKEGESTLTLSVPSDAEEGIYSFSVKATSGKLIHYAALSVEVFTYDAELSLTKQADKTTVTVGEEVTFSISCANDGDVPLKNITVTDTLDSAFQYISANPVPVINDSQLSFSLGDLAVGESKTITIKIKITENAETYGSASNYAEASCDRIPSKRSNSVTIKIGTPSLSLAKSLRNANPNFKPGGIVIYELLLKNRGSAPVYNLIIRDILPSGFFYITGRTVINGTIASDPEKSGSELIWKVNKLESGKSLTLVYQVSISSDVKTGKHINSADVTAVDGSGKSLTAGPAQVLVMVSRGVVLLYSSIEGTVFEDADADGYYGAADKPLPNIMVMLEMGERTVTDSNGEFVFESLLPGEHLVTIDTRTLPSDLEPAKKFYIANPLEGAKEYLDIPINIKDQGKIEGKLLWDSSTAENITSFTLSGIKVLLDGKYYVLSSENGAFVFDAVPAGEHLISVPAELLPQGINLKSEQTQSVEVFQRKTSDIEFILNGNPYGSIEGRVYTSGSNSRISASVPVEGIVIILKDGIKAVTDSAGVFKFDNVVPGKYQLTIDPLILDQKHYRTKISKQPELEITAGRIQSVEIQLESLAFLEIKIK